VGVALNWWDCTYVVAVFLGLTHKPAAPIKLGIVGKISSQGHPQPYASIFACLLVVLREKEREGIERERERSIYVLM
jgi:hypothetical protein